MASLQFHTKKLRQRKFLNYTSKIIFPASKHIGTQEVPQNIDLKTIKYFPSRLKPTGIEGSLKNLRAEDPASNYFPPVFTNKQMG